VLVDDRARDLDLVVALLNTYDAYASHPERLDTVASLVRLVEEVGWSDVATSRLAHRDVVAVKDLREQVRAVFAAAADEDVDGAAELCSGLLARVRPVLAVRPGDPRASLGLAEEGADVVRRFETRVSVAVAIALATPGVKLGLCVAHPCRCAYVDRSRAGSRRFCCQLCADRFAAAAYRRRQRSTGAPSQG
jgi:predicted RNA-binding Zn ribbon-like protein